ncbi:MAG: Type 1 glutamine amidotransferase-like domain-containing protein, partial [Pseudomonadota bacterium]
RDARKITVIQNKEDLQKPEIVAALSSMDTALIHFCGGDQKRFMDMMKDTDVPALIKERFKKGNIVISGNSAGAHLFSDFMIYQEDIKQRGLGLTPLVIDTHIDVYSHKRTSV